MAALLFPLPWPEPGSAAEPAKAPGEVDVRLVDVSSQLGDRDPAVRRAAAEQLRNTYVAPDRNTWNALLAALRPGVTKEQLLARLTPQQAKSEGGHGTGPNHMEDYRLDDLWILRCWFRNDGDVLFEVSLAERMRELWVAPPEGFSGTWVTYFVNGRKAHQIEYREGKYHGTYVAFHASGGKSYVQHYVNHVAHGEDTGYFPSGKVSYRGRYQDGKQVGEWTWFNEDGSVRSTQRH